ncbi:hypothetical protein [Oligosphaera ethanolica]|uniref:Uncharacterized protein n=1 Tax=Oligosphaera ethanolica TaxID=760260 RepID=A0AAE3VFH1_9BACT|nr:hypothetical protein [Oligosphaera ethanolica]MDQ0289505.1 hypothetical protein [Oligosphaera ethanolica]
MTDREIAWRDALSAHSSSGMPLSAEKRLSAMRIEFGFFYRGRIGL